MSNRNGVWSLPAQYQAIADQDWTMAPGAPTGVSATAGSTQAEVSFTAPTFAGIPGTITQFKVTSSSGQTATGSSSPITVTGLTNGNAVTFTAQAQNAIGLGKASDASSSVTPLAEVISGLFSTFLYDGTGSAQTITNGINLSGKGGAVWSKRRDNTSGGGPWFNDTERGITKYIGTYDAGVETDSSSSLSATTSTGYTLGGSFSGWNNSSGEYVSWTFRKEPKLFDIVTYTGNGSNRTISHNLASAPGMILIKNRGQGDNWAVFHRSVNNETNPENYVLTLNTTAGDASGVFNGTAPTSSVFSVGTDHTVNANGENYVAYLFAHNNNDGGFGPDGEDIIKCGHFQTDGNEDATIDLGFEPQWVLFKRYNSSTGGDWNIYDNMRGMQGDFLSQAALLEANTTDVEDATTNRIAVTSTGFKIDNYGDNRPFIYVAIRRPDQSTPTAASDVFSIHNRDGEPNSTELNLGNTHLIDMVMSANRYDAGTTYRYITDRLRGDDKLLFPSGTDAESTGSNYIEFDRNSGNAIPAGGWGNNSGGTGADSVFWMWKRAKGYFDMVPYTGTGSATTVTHNLGAVPEMMWIKCRSNTDNWAVYHSGIGATKVIFLNNDIAAATLSTRFNDTAPTSSVFTVGTDNEVNGSGRTYIAYLFATVAGVSKLGTCSHTFGGGNTDVDCGFSNGCRFLLIKSTTHNYNWEVYDTERGITTGNDPYIKLNTTDAEVTNNNGINPLSSGFTLMSTGWNTGTYIFYAIA